MIVVDSSGWIEFFSDGPHADEFAKRLRRQAEIITPTIAIYEVYKWIKRERSEEDALQAIATMKTTRITDLTENLALTAADISLSHGLAMADAIVLAVARTNGAELVTTDTDFEGVPNVTVFSKKQR